MDRHELNRMFDGLAPDPHREQELLKKLLQENVRRKRPMKSWKRVVLAAAAAALMVTGAAAANPEAVASLIERLTVQVSPDSSYKVSGSAMTKYPLDAFSPALNSASEGRDSVVVSLNFDTWEETRAFLGKDIPCIWLSDWDGQFQVLLFHTELERLWGVDVCSVDYDRGEVYIAIRTELWPGENAVTGMGYGEGSTEYLCSYTMANGSVAELIEHLGTEEHPFASYVGHFMKDGILYDVTNEVRNSNPEEAVDHLKAILDSFPQ